MAPSRLLLVVALGLTGLGLWTFKRLDLDGPEPPPTSGPTAHARDPIVLAAPDTRKTTPELTVINDHGETRALSTLWPNRPVLVHFWATWCAPCIAELPGLNELARQSDGKLTILPISLDRDAIEETRKYFAAHHLDALAILASAPGSPTPEVLPTSFLVDRMGREAWKAVGAHPWTGTDVQTAIEALQ